MSKKRSLEKSYENLKKHSWILLTSVALFVSVAAILIFPMKGSDPESNEAVIEEVEPLEDIPKSIRTRLLFGGDIFLGRSVQLKSLSSELGYAYPFQNMDSLNPERYQAIIANLECPATNTLVPISEQSTYLKFNCLPDFLPELAKYFDVVSLSNNHTDNVNGLLGLNETKKHLELNNIQYFGHYSNAVLSDLCEIVTVDAKLQYEKNEEDAAIPIALCGYHGVFAIPLDSELDVIKTYAKYLPTIVMPHMGAEYRTSSDHIRERVYRTMIDNGADVVVGGHPHWVQNAEEYKGKLILYSVGNLIFDQRGSDEVKRSVMLDITIDIDYDENAAIWLTMAKECYEYHDTCLRRAEDGQLDKLKTEFKYDIVGTYLTDMVVGRASNAVQQQLLSRVNWTEVSNQLD